MLRTGTSSKSFAKPEKSLVSFVPTLAVFAAFALTGLLSALGAPVSSVAADEGDTKMAETQTAEELATHFLEIFAQKDIDTVSTMFAPGALVQRARLSDGPPELVSFEAQAWAEDARQGIASVEDFKIEVLDVVSASFGEGITVSVQFRATGRVGENTFFINNGVDSFSFIQMGGEWKIALYNSMEKLEIGG